MRKPKRYESESVQGPGSYVVMWRRTHGQAKHMKRMDPMAEDSNAEIEKMLAAAIVEWNWKDADGEPLPVPGKDPATVFDPMPENEAAFLMECWLGRIDPKNGDTTSGAPPSAEPVKSQRNT